MNIVTGKLVEAEVREVSSWAASGILPSIDGVRLMESVSASIAHPIFYLDSSKLLDDHSLNEFNKTSCMSFFKSHIVKGGMMAMLVDRTKEFEPLAMVELVTSGSTAKFSNFITGPLVSWFHDTIEEVERSKEVLASRFSLNSVRVPMLQLSALWFSSDGPDNDFICVPNYELEVQLESTANPMNFPLQISPNGTFSKTDVPTYIRYAKAVAQERYLYQDATTDE